MCFHRTVKADEALREGDYRRCISILSRAIALDPHNPELFRTRAEAHFQLSDYPAAVANYRKTVSLSPSEAAGLAPRMADAYYKNGCGLRNRNDVTSALEAFTKASELCPNEREYIMQRYVVGVVNNHVGVVYSQSISTVLDIILSLLAGLTVCCLSVTMTTVLH